MRIISAVLFVCVLANFAQAESSVKKDSWWKDPPDPAIFFNNQIPDSNVAEVAQPLQASAQLLLRRTSVKEITKAQAERYSNRSIQPKGDGSLRYYLIRSVRLVGSGRYNAYRFRTSVYIIHGDLGGVRQVKRSAVVLAVDGAITDVFAACATVK
jgi:hypothetical protein